MLLQDILEEADMLAPNAVSQDRKIRYINEIQRRIYRDYPLNLVSYFFYTVANQTNYTLPSDCNEENIEAIFIDNNEWYYHTMEDKSVNGYGYFIENGDIILAQTPTTQMEGYITYRQAPADLTATDLPNEVPFMPDYHELYVLGLAAKLAMLQGNFGDAEQYEVRFNNLAVEAIRKIKRIKIRKVRHVRRWS